MKLPPCQTKVLTAIRDYRHRNGFAPTLQEVGETLGISKKTVVDHVAALERKGVIRRDALKARSIEIIADVLPARARLPKLAVLGTVGGGGRIRWGKRWARGGGLNVP